MFKLMTLVEFIQEKNLDKPYWKSPNGVTLKVRKMSK